MQPVIRQGRAKPSRLLDLLRTTRLGAESLTHRSLDEAKHQLFGSLCGVHLVGGRARVGELHVGVGGVGGVVDGGQHGPGDDEEARQRDEQQHVQTEHPAQEHEVGQHSETVVTCTKQRMNE